MQGSDFDGFAFVSEADVIFLGDGFLFGGIGWPEGEGPVVEPASGLFGHISEHGEGFAVDGEHFGVAMVENSPIAGGGHGAVPDDGVEDGLSEEDMGSGGEPGIVKGIEEVLSVFLDDIEKSGFQRVGDGMVGGQWEEGAVPEGEWLCECHRLCLADAMEAFACLGRGMDSEGFRLCRDLANALDVEVVGMAVGDDDVRDGIGGSSKALQGSRDGGAAVEEDVIVQNGGGAAENAFFPIVRPIKIRRTSSNELQFHEF